MAAESSLIEGFRDVILIEGPAGVEVVAGILEVFGRELSSGDRFVVPIGRSIPALLRGRIRVSGGSVRRVSNDIYVFMERLAKTLAERHGRILLIGPTDSGKSTVAAWTSVLSNSELLIVDVGQNEYYAPAFEALVKPPSRGPLIPGSNAELVRRCFVGSFAPSGALGRYISCAAMLASRARDALVIDTDGWLSGYGALESKVALVEAVQPDTLVFLGVDARLREKIAAFARFSEIVAFDRPPVRVKSREERRLHRERLVALRIVGGREISLAASKVPVIGSPVFRCNNGPDPSKSEVLGPGLVYIESCEGALVTVYRRKPKRPLSGAKVLEAGWERGLLVGLVGSDGDHYLGVVRRVNYRTRVFTIITQYTDIPKGAILGTARVAVEVGG